MITLFILSLCSTRTAWIHIILNTSIISQNLCVLCLMSCVFCCRCYTFLAWAAAATSDFFWNQSSGWMFLFWFLKWLTFNLFCVLLMITVCCVLSMNTKTHLKINNKTWKTSGFINQNGIKMLYLYFKTFTDSNGSLRSQSRIKVTPLRGVQYLVWHD